LNGLKKTARIRRTPIALASYRFYAYGEKGPVMIGYDLPLSVLKNTDSEA
jgi:hypothetical protein